VVIGIIGVAKLYVGVASAGAARLHRTTSIGSSKRNVKARLAVKKVAGVYFA
jgi:hypothetical protein